MSNLRILSLLPAATEIVYLLGLEKYLVGVSDNCDYPPQAKSLPKVTECQIDNNLTSRQIDEKVKSLGHRGINVSHLDEVRLKELKPNLILTQDICQVCAVSYTQVQRAARVLDGDTKIISLEPESVEDILDNILLIGEKTGKDKKAKKVLRNLKERLKNLDSKFMIHDSPKPKVLVVEWLDPIMIAGHWVPEMVEKAGGEMLITKVGEKSHTINLTQMKLNPDILIFSPCGFDTQRTLKERKVIKKIVKHFKNAKVYLVDGNSYMTRPGPRIVDGIEILAEILQAEVFLRKHSKKDWMEFK